MRTLRQFAQFVGKPGPAYSVQALEDYLFLGSGPISLRGMIQQFEGLPAPFDFPLDVKPTSGGAPLLVNARYGEFVGVRIRGEPGPGGIMEFRVLKNGQVIREIPSLTGFAHQFDEGGQYVIEGTAEGVGSTGYAKVVRTVTINVKGKPPPPPPPPPEPNLVIAVASAGGGAFTVTGTGFLPNHSVFIRIVDKARPLENFVFVEETSTPQGTFEYHTGNICGLGGPAFVFSAHDGRLKDGMEIFSNYVTKTCSAG